MYEICTFIGRYYNYEFSGSKTRVNEFLIGGILTALSSSMGEVMGTTESIEKIQLGDLQITFQQIDDENLFLLITKRSSKFIEQVLTNFTYEFINCYGEKLRNLEMTKAMEFEDTRKLVDKFFSIGGIYRPTRIEFPTISSEKTTTI